ncbi:MAG: class I SAM-dependent methyltransferase [Pleurocapsa sp. MO_226.B13]|nr:class I SAM-dependent methyltransferase [Pleurocapsa sp. MO_226.B13]
MNQNLTEKIRNDFDRLALYEVEQWNHNNHYHQFLLKQLPPRCETVLDLGCGVGEFSRLLAERAERVVAIDLSPNSIKIAREKSRQFSNIDYQIADVRGWELLPEHFDAIASIATFHHLSLTELLPKLKAALKPGGVLVVLDLLKNHHLRGLLSDAIAVPLNWYFLKLKNRDVRVSPEAKAAMQEHIRTDKYLNLVEVKKIYTEFLTTPKIRKHLLWRYSVVWQKPDR